MSDPIEVTQEFISQYQSVIDVMKTVKFLAIIDPEQTTANLIAAHPQVALATTITVLDSIELIQERIATALVGQPDIEIYTRENILLAVMIGMQLGAFSLETKLKDSFNELSASIFELTNPPSEMIN